MALAEVLLGARALPRREQLRLIQELTAGLRQDTADDAIEPGREYAVWSPHSPEAAAELLRALNRPTTGS